MTMTQQLATMYAYAARVLGQDASGHGMDHIDRVLANARLILAQTPEATAVIVLTAATLHDTYDEKIVANQTEARAQTADEMRAAGYTSNQVRAILTIIDQMSFSYGLEHEVHLSLEGKIVQDADRLDAIGAIGIARAFAYGGAKGRPLDDGREARQNLTKAAYRRNNGGTIQHFHEKLLQVAATLNTPAAQEIGRARTAYMQNFLAEFAAEVAGEK